MSIKGQAIIFNLAKNQKTALRKSYYNQIVYYTEGLINMSEITKQELLLVSHRRFERVCNLNEEEFQLVQNNFGKNPVCVVQKEDRTVFLSEDPVAIEIWKDYFGI